MHVSLTREMLFIKKSCHQNESHMDDDHALNTGCFSEYTLKLHSMFLQSFILHPLENRTGSISTPHNGQCQWDSNLHTSACKSSILPLYYRHQLHFITGSALENLVIDHGNFTRKLQLLLCSHCLQWKWWETMQWANGPILHFKHRPKGHWSVFVASWHSLYDIKVNITWSLLSVHVIAINLHNILALSVTVSCQEEKLWYVKYLLSGNNANPNDTLYNLVMIHWLTSWLT